MTESVGGVPRREEPVPVEDSDRVGDRFEDAMLAVRDAELDSDDVRDRSEAVEV